MKCKQVKRLINDYLEARLLAPERAGMETHLGACDSCRGTLRATQVAIQTLGELPPQQVSEDFWMKLECRLPDKSPMCNRIATGLVDWLAWPPHRLAAAGVGIAVASALLFIGSHGQRENVEIGLTHYQPSAAYVMQGVEQHAAYAGDQTMPELAVPDSLVRDGKSRD